MDDFDIEEEVADNNEAARVAEIKRRNEEIDSLYPTPPPEKKEKLRRVYE